MTKVTAYKGSLNKIYLFSSFLPSFPSLGETKIFSTNLHENKKQLFVAFFKSFFMIHHLLKLSAINTKI